MAEVFVSHRGTDSATAARLKAALEKRGHHVWLDLDAIRAGDSIIERMEHGIAHADAIVVLYSSAPGAGSWFDREWQSTLARILSGDRIRLVPARMPGSSPPALLADIKYADLASWEEGIEAIDKGIS